MTSILLDILAQQICDAEKRADRVYEAVIGIVTDNKDPKKLSRVKVRFPTLPGNDTSAWAPISALGAGEDRGWYFLPEIDDEVLVMFAHGDINRPVVLGALWNGQDPPPDSNNGKNERKTIVSRAGSRIVLDDENKTITLEDGGGKGKIEIAEDKITIESASGDVCIQAPNGELNIVADELNVDGQNTLTVVSGGDLNIGGDGKVTFEAGMSLMVSGSTIDLNPGGVPAPAEVSASCEEIPTQLEGGGNSGGGGSHGAPSSGAAAAATAATGAASPTLSASPAGSEADGGPR